MITIIVLIILAGISINLLLGDNGLISKAKSAAVQQVIAEKKEAVALALQEEFIAERGVASNITVEGLLKELQTSQKSTVIYALKDVNGTETTITATQGNTPLGCKVVFPKEITGAVKADVIVIVDSYGKVTNVITEDDDTPTQTEYSVTISKGTGVASFTMSINNGTATNYTSTYTATLENGARVTISATYEEGYRAGTGTGTIIIDSNKTIQITAVANTTPTVENVAKNGQIQRWDKVNYTPGTNTTASISLQGGATLSDTISATEASDWVVLNVNENTGEVEIIPRTYSSKGLNMGGIDCYNNAITMLNNISSIYCNTTYATSSRSLTVRDINNVENYTTSGVNFSYSWNQRYGMDDNLNLIDYGEGNVEERTYTSTPETKGYEYQTNYFSNWYCWLASRNVNLDSGGCVFNLFFLDHGEVYYHSSFFGVYKHGGTMPAGSSRPIVPVVTLKTDIKMQKDSNNVWQLSV